MRSFDTVYKIDGQAMLAPDAEVELSRNDLDGEAAGRDAAGYMHRSVLRSGVRTWGFTYSALTQQELDYLLGLLDGKATVSFTCETGTVTAYCAKQEVRLFDRTRGVYKALKFSIIEC